MGERTVDQWAGDRWVMRETQKGDWMRKVGDGGEREGGSY